MKVKITSDQQYLSLFGGTKQEMSRVRAFFKPKVKGYQHMPRYKMRVWDGTLDFYNDGLLRIGLWKELERCCKQYGMPLEVVNKENFPREKVALGDVEDFCEDYFERHRTHDGDVFKPRDYQQQAIWNLLRHRYGGIEVATAGGKSLIYSTFMFYVWKRIDPEAKFLLVVPSKLLVSQFYDDVHQYAEGFKQDAKDPVELRVSEMHSESPRQWHEPNESNLWICTWQSLSKAPAKWLQQFSGAMLDEGHLGKGKEISKIFRNLYHCRWRHSMSGTFYKDGFADQFTIQQSTGPVVYRITAEQLQKRDYIAPVQIHGCILEHNDVGFAQAVRQIRKTGSGADAFRLETEYAQNSINRVKMLQALVKRSKYNTLVLFKNIDYGSMLYDTLRQEMGSDKLFYYIDGSVKKKKRDYIKEQMEIVDDAQRVLVATYKTLGTGVSINAIANIIFADSYKSEQLIRQSIGRGLRQHKLKDKLIVWDMVDTFSPKRDNVLFSHWEERCRIYKEQNFPYDVRSISLRRDE